MATQSTLYDLESTESRFFLSTKPIASKSHVAIWIKGEDDVYRIQNESDYELINDTIVYPAVPSGKALEVRVGDSPSDLVNAPTDISIVSAIADEIVIVADNVQDIINVSDNIVSITIVSDNMTELLVISDNIDSVLLAKEYAVNPEDVAITDNPSDFSSLHHASKAKASVEEAQAVVDSINFPAGLIMEWNSDRKPSGWLWCDGESYSAFSPLPSLAYDELYAVLEDPEYVMTTKPEDWDVNYPDDPNGWYDPSFAGSVVTQAELDLLVTVPDRRGVFVRGKDRHGSVGTTRGLDSHGVVALNAVIPSQIQDHTHTYSRYYHTSDDTISGSGHSANNSDQYNTQTTAGAGNATVGSETHGTYVTTNFIIRAKGSYNGDGTGSGGTGVVPIASEIDYSDTHNSGNTNLQDTTDDYYKTKAVTMHNGGLRPVAPVQIGSIINQEPYVTNISIGANFATDRLMCVATREQGTETYGDTYISVVNADTFAIVDTDSGISHGFPAGGLNGNGYYITDDSSATTSWKWAVINAHTSVQTLGTSISAVDGPNLHHSAVGFGDSQHVCSVLRSTTLHTYILNDSGSYIALVTQGASTGFNGAGADSTNGFVVRMSTDKLSLLIYSGATLLYTKVLTGSPVPLTAGSIVYPSGETDTYVAFNAEGVVYGYRKDELANNDAITPELITAYAGSYSAVAEGGLVYVTERYDPTPRDVREIDIHSAIPTEQIELVPYKNTIDIRTADYSIDLSIAEGSASTYFGLDTGSEYSFLFGTDMIASYAGTVAVGTGLQPSREDQKIYGHWNASSTATVLLGCGTEGVRANGLEIFGTGDVQAPNRLAVPNATSLLTKDIADALYNNYSPTGYTGDIVVDSDAGTTVTTITVVDGLITGTAVV